MNWEQQLASIVHTEEEAARAMALVRANQLFDVERRLPGISALFADVDRFYHRHHAGGKGYLVFRNEPNIIQTGQLLIIGMNPGLDNGRTDTKMFSDVPNDWVLAGWPAAHGWRHLFRRVFGEVWQEVLSQAPTSNLCPIRTAHEWQLSEDDICFSVALWTSMLDILAPRRVLICSKRAAHELLPVMEAQFGDRRAVDVHRVGQHPGSCEIWRHEAATVAVVPHPSRWTINAPLTLDALQEALLG